MSLESGLRPLGPARELAAIWMFVRRELQIQVYFRFSFFSSLVETASSLVIYGMIARFGQALPSVQAIAGGDYVSFVLSGIVLNTLLATALSGPYFGLMNTFWQGRTEVLLASPLRLHVFVTGVSAGRYVDAALRIAIYLAGGTLFLGLVWPSLAGLIAALPVFVLAAVACTGLGLAAASTVYLLDARGGHDPVRLVVETIVGLVGGVYFPVTILPLWAQWIGQAVPHTYAIDGMRRAFYGSAQLPPLPLHAALGLEPLLGDCLALAIYAAVTLPVGWVLFQRGLRLARTDGRLSRWV
jgi:ABC-2 type transport system permease protein